VKTVFAVPSKPEVPTNVFSDLEPFTETQPVGHHRSRSG